MLEIPRTRLKILHSSVASLLPHTMVAAVPGLRSHVLTGVAHCHEVDAALPTNSLEVDRHVLSDHVEEKHRCGLTSVALESALMIL